MTHSFRILGLTILVLSLTVLCAPFPSLAASLAALQRQIDVAKSGDTIIPEPGIYKGNLIIGKPITLDGQGKVTIDADGVGSVIILKTNGATIRGLHLKNSGESHNDLDSGIQVRGNYNVIKDNEIEDCLFGIDIQQAENNIILRNRIGSKAFDLGVRGDGIRLWYSKNNRIEDNTIRDSRDVVVWYSSDNVFKRNKISGGRYGLHFMYSLYNLVEDNRLDNNSVGVFLMYSDSVIIRKNHISRAIGSTGMGVGMKETSDVTIEDNAIIYCAIGIYLDVSPYQPGTTNKIRNNRLAFNSIGIKFHNDWTGNLIEDNQLKSNYVQVSVNAGASAQRNGWDGNFWDDYRGFDQNGDGIGDSPHELKVYADRIWMDVPVASFFKSSAVLSLLDFLERLAPFSEPVVLLNDPRPKLTAETVVARAETSERKATKDDPPFKYDPFGLSKRVPKYLNNADIKK